MDLNLELYRVFYIVAKCGSITKATDFLYISQPAITFQIKKLERELGVCLFTRTKHGVSLTFEGEVLFNYVKNALDSIVNGENALSNLKNLDRGTIRIGGSTTICRNILIPYLKKFHQMYPKIDIKINNNLSIDLLKELKNGNLDILFSFTSLGENKDLTITPLKEVQDIFVCNKKYYDLTKGKLNVTDLVNYPLIFPSSPSSSRTFLDNYLKKNDINLQPKLEVVSYGLIVDLIKAGFGIGFVTKEFVQEELDSCLLYEIEVTHEIPRRTIFIVTMKQKEINYSVKRFIQMVMDIK